MDDDLSSGAVSLTERPQLKNKLSKETTPLKQLSPLRRKQSAVSNDSERGAALELEKYLHSYHRELDRLSENHSSLSRGD